MSTPAYIYIAIMLFGLGVESMKNGKPKTGNHSFVGSLISNAVVLGLLYWGGFFSAVRT